MVKLGFTSVNEAILADSTFYNEGKAYLEGDYNPKKLNRLLIERLGCTEEEFILIKKYIKNSKILSFKVVLIVHGEDLDKDLSVSVLKPVQKEAYYRAIHELKERLAKIRETGLQKLQTILGMNDSDFAIATQFLRKFDSEKIMESLFGKDFQDEGNIAILNSEQERMFYRLIKQSQDYVRMQRKTIVLQNVLNCPDDIWPEIRYYILQKEELCKLFIPIFGSDLSKESEISHINTAEKNNLASAIKDLRKTISGYLRYVNKDLATIASLDESEEDIVYTLICDNSELTALFGNDFSLTLSGNSYLEKGRENVRELLDSVLEDKRRFRKLKRLQQYSVPSDNININGINITKYDIDLLREALKLVPIRYRGILILHLGFGGDGKFYPSERLAVIFNKNVSDIESDILHGKAYLEEIIETCKKANEREFSLAENECWSRKRVSEN